MRHPLIASTVALATLLSVGVFMPETGSAQQGGRPGQPPPVAPIKPYKAIAVTPPKPMSDASFDAFRKQLADVASARTAPGWPNWSRRRAFSGCKKRTWRTRQIRRRQSRQGRRSRRQGRLGLGGAQQLAATDRPPSPCRTTKAWCVRRPLRLRYECARRPPQVDRKPTRPTGATSSRTASRRAARRQPNAPVVEKLGLILVRVLPDDAPPADNAAPTAIHTSRRRPARAHSSRPTRSRRSPTMDLLPQGRQRLEDHRLSRRRRPVNMPPRHSGRGYRFGLFVGSAPE